MSRTYRTRSHRHRWIRYLMALVAGSATRPSPAPGQVDCLLDPSCASTGLVYFPRAENSVGLNDRYIERHAIDDQVMLIGWPQEGTSQTGFVQAYRYIAGQGWELQDELRNRGAIPTDRYGEAVDVSGSWAMVGAPHEERDPGGPALYKGAVHIYRYDPGTGQWNPEGRLSPPTIEPDSGHDFGVSVKLQGLRAMVGMPLWPLTIPSSTASGGVFIYEYDGLAWLETARIEPPVDQYIFDFGRRLAGHDQRIIVGAPGSGDGAVNEENRGSAFIYRNENQAWILEARLDPDPPTPHGWFGQSVDICGNVAMVGQRYYADTGFGAVHVYENDGVAWIRTSVLQPDDLCEAEGSIPQCHFSRSLALGHDLAVIGSPRENLTGAIDQGCAYVYRRDPATQDWCLHMKLLPPGPSNAPDGPAFGLAVAMEKGTGRTLIGNLETDQGIANSTTLYDPGATGPSIIDQPQPVNAIVGDTATFGVIASESPASYLWHRDGIALVDDGRITGVATEMLTINAVELSDAGDYDVVVTTLCGSITSAPASLDVERPCPDPNFDQVVDIEDLLTTLSVWGSCAPPCPYDFDASGAVDILDLLFLLSRWGPC